MLSDKYLRIGFWAALILGVALHAWTLPYSSNHWQDEVQICEIGRRVYEKTDWNMYMMPEARMDTIAPGIWLVGPVAQETSYRLFGHLGPKIAALFYLLLATVLLRFYLKRKTNSETIATLVPLVFFATPGLVQSVRGARVDILAFLFLFTALAILQCRVKNATQRNFVFIGFGASCALSVFTWPTAILMMPIAVWELWEYWRENHLSLSIVIMILLSAAVGAVLLSIVALSPTFYDPRTSLEIYRFFSRSSMNESRVVQWLPMMRAMLSSLGVYALGACCLFLCRRSFILLLGGVAFFLVCAASSRIYVFKTVYFVPYAVLGMALFCQSLSNRKMAKFVNIAIFLLCAACYSRSVLIRNPVEFLARHYRNVDNQTEIISQYINKGAKVYNLAWQTYFPCRKLGLKQFQYYFEPPSAMALKCYDYILLDEDALSMDDFVLQIKDNGFVLVRKITIDPIKTSPYDGFSKKYNRLLPLGPYWLFGKKEKCRCS